MRKTAAEKAAQQTEIADRRRKVAALALARVPQNEIARQLKASPATICLDLAALRAEWRAERGPDVAAMQDQDVAALSADEMRWRQKWATVTETDLQLRIYDRILRISERRAKLLGLDAPAKADVTSNGQTITNFLTLVQAATHGRSD